MQSKSKIFFNTLFGLFLLFFVSIAFGYTFPGSLPPDCTQSGSNFTCSSAVTLDRNVTFTGSGNVTVTINNTLTIRSYTIGSGSDNANVTFVVNGTVWIDSATIYANISAGSNIIQVNTGQWPSIFGNLTTTSGSITARGDIQGNISSTSGQINLNDATYVNGTVTNQTGTTNIYNNSRVSGAVSSTSGQIILYGNNTLSSTLSCSTCTVTINNTGSRIDGAVTVGVLNDNCANSSPGTIYNGAIRTLTGNATIGYHATVNGNINAFNDVYIRERATVNGNVTALDLIQVQYFAFLNGNATVSSNANSVKVEIQNDGRMTGNISATATGSLQNLEVYLRYRTTFNGSITANSAHGLNLDVHDDSVFNGNITVFGASSAKVRVGHRTVVTGDITVNSNTNDNGDIEIHPNARVNGSLKAFGDISQSGTVTGCVQSTYTTGGSTHKNVTLNSGSSTGGVCQGTSSCTSDLGFVTLGSGVSMPPICGLNATLIAQYHLDETSWNGTLNETKDNAGFTGGPFDGQGIGSPMPTAANSSPAKPGSNGTCGYATFTGAQTGGSAMTLDGLPVNTAAGAKTSVSFWMYWDGVSNNVAPIGWFRYNLYFSGSFFGFNTDSGDMNGINNASLANGWNHVVAVFTNGAVASNKLYINGNIQTFTKNDPATLSNAVVASTLQLSGQTRNQNWRFFNGRVDEVKVYNGEVTQAQVTADFNATHACAMTAYYKFDEETWSTTAPEVKDSGGSNLHATLATRSGSAKPTIGYINPALSGSNGTCNYGVFTDQQYVSLPVGFPNLNTNFTISAWFNTSNANKGTQRIISDDANNNGGYLLTLNANDHIGKIKLSTRGTVPQFVEFYHTIESNKWYFVAARVNASTNKIKLYLYDNNGTLINSVESTGALTTSDNGLASIGAEASGSEVYGFVGSLDEIKLFSKALSDAEITALSQERHACPTYGKLEAYYQFDEYAWNGSANEIIDSSGNNFHATLSRRSGTTNATIGYKTPALSGASGTCNYGVFTDQQLVSLPASFPSLNTNFTLSAWFNTANANQATQRIISDDAGSAGGAGTTGHALTLNDNGEMNKLKFFTRSPSIVAEINHAFQSNTWYYTAVSINASTNTVKLFLYNAAGGLISSTTVSGSSSAFDNGLTTIGAEPIGSAEVRGFNGFLDEIRLYSRALSDAEIATLSQDRHACQPFNYNETATDFNCVIPNGDSKTGRLYTQLAGTAFNFDVLARNASGDVETGFADASNQTVTVEFVDSTNYANATACVANSPATNAIVTQSITFLDADNGRKANQTATINGAYKNLRCRIKEGATIKGCSQDNFAVRPSSFTISSSNANADSNPSANPNRNENATTVFKAALDHFNLTANTNTVGYDGKPMIRTPADLDKGDVYSWASGAAPLNNYALAELSRTLGSVTGEFSNANISNGNAVGNTFKYTEVGYFRFQPHSIVDTTFTAVDQAGGDCTADYSNTLVNGKYGCNIGHNHNGSRTAFFGRFIPAYFTISPSTTTPACNSFTYYGQDGLSTTFTITARNGDGNTTINYTNNAANEGEIYGKLNLSAPASFNFTPSSGSISSSSITSAGSWIRGQATVTAKHIITRTNTLTAPTDIKIFAKPTDSDLVTMPAPTAVSTDSPFRYGRLKVSNAYGSELLPLSIPIEAQYWDGTNYRRNIDDGCTNIGTANVTLSNYQKNLSTGEIALSGGGAMNAGKSKFTLSKPSEVNKGPGAGKNGSVDINFNLLNFPWLGSGTQAARATFGLYKSPIIYMRENY